MRHGQYARKKGLSFTSFHGNICMQSRAAVSSEAEKSKKTPNL